MQPVLELNNQDIIIPKSNGTNQEITWYGRVWKIVTAPFIWVIEKITAFINYLFSKKDNSLTNNENIYTYIPKSTSFIAPKDGGPVDQATVEKLIEDLKGTGFFLKESICSSDFECLKSLCLDKALLKDQLDSLKKFVSLGLGIKNSIQLAVDLWAFGNDQAKASLNDFINALRGEIRTKFYEELSKHGAAIIAVFYSVQNKIFAQDVSPEMLKEWVEILYFLKDLLEDDDPLLESLKKIESEIANSLKQAIDRYNKNSAALFTQKVEEKNEMHAVIGIGNIGNSCYMNSVLQAMLASKRISAAIDQDIPLAEDPELTCSTRPRIEVRNSLKKFRNLYYETANNKRSPDLLKKGAWDLREKIFSSRICAMSGLTGQQDAADLMRPLLESIDVCFESRIETSTKENPNENPHIQIKPEQLLMLEVPQQKTAILFEDLLKEYSQVEKVQDSVNQWRYKYKTFEKRYSIGQELPNTLVIQLKRFQWSRMSTKIETPINIGDVVDFSPILDLELTQKREPTYFKLCSYINHHGIPGVGHYTANRKEKDKVWKNCNDSIVSDVSSQTEKQNRESAYILVFERV
jgi:ubiquitin C-terminal hydrolase